MCGVGEDGYDRLAPGRRAVVVVVGGAAGELVDDVRRRWDSTMAARIAPHVTLVHHVVDTDGLSERLAIVAAATAPFRARLAGVGGWGEARYGTYLEVEDTTGGLRALYDALMELEEPRWRRAGFRPHVTLVHGRTTEVATAEEAAAALAGWRADVDVRVDAVSVLQLGRERWDEIVRAQFRAC